MKSEIMAYKGYLANISYDADESIFCGEVSGISDLLTFHGKTKEELEVAFRDCIDNYLGVCNRISNDNSGIGVKKNVSFEYSGVFGIRVTPRLHEKVSKYADKRGISINQVISRALEAFFSDEDSKESEENGDNK